MTIPKLHYITENKSPKALLEDIQKACTSGAELIHLRLKSVSEKKVLKLAKEAIKITSHFQTRLIINEHYKVAKEIKADGVHLEKTNVCPTKVRKHLYTWQILGGTANNIEDCKILIEKEIDYITLSPFKDNKTDNATDKPLGLDGFKAISETLNTETPILGSGEITTDDVTNILECGISGLAVSEAITTNFDSIKTFHQLLKASSTEEKRHTFKSE